MHVHALSRAWFLRATAVVGAITWASSSSALAMETEMTPDSALKRLMAGNAKFVAGALPAQTAIAERRSEVASSQHPFAMILSCADSRVPIEHVFDQLIGDLFVCRVAGNIADPPTVGSFEYAVANFKSPRVLVVLAHQKCGAVNATISLAKSGKTAPGSIQSIVDALKPAVDATPQGSLTGYAYADAVAKTNAKMIAKNLSESSEILKDAVEAKKLSVVPAFYSLDSGTVSLLS
jgi:carbonic anhydrase